jgi:hypothetical protein
MPSELHIFDFDNTLFKSPTNIPENHQKYEKLTGLPWIITKEMSKELSDKHGKKIRQRSGWFGRPETLEPPLVPIPAPQDWFITEATEALFESKRNKDSVTLIVTGRHQGLKQHVLRICNDGNLIEVVTILKQSFSNIGPLLGESDDNVRLHCLGESGPDPVGVMPSETLPWKIWLVEQYLRLNPEIKKTIFWEDREEHVMHFRELDGILCESVVVNHIKCD